MLTKEEITPWLKYHPKLQITETDGTVREETDEEWCVRQRGEKLVITYHPFDAFNENFKG